MLTRGDEGAGETPLARARSRSWLRFLLFIVGVSVAVIAFVDPRGNFPLDDDWSFALSTWHLAETGEIRLARFTGMSLRAQLVWGAMWTRLAGESFEVLRASTLVLALGSLLLFATLARAVLRDQKKVSLAVLIFACNPIFVWASFTYMTHVPFIFLQLLAAVAFAAFMTRGSVALVVAGAVAALASCFVRQTGVGILIAAAMTFLLARDVRRRREAVATVAGAAGLFVVLYLFTDVLHGNLQDHALHASTRGTALAERAEWLLRSTRNAFLMNLEYGVVFLPALAVISFVTFKGGRKATLSLLLMALPFMAFASHMTGVGQPFPYPIGGNVLENLAIGPLTLRDTFTFSLPYTRALPFVVLPVLTYAVAAAGAFALWWLGCRLVAALRSREASELFLVTQLLVGCVMLIPGGLYFDRHSLDSLWPAALLVAGGMGVLSRRVVVAAVAVTVLAGALGVVGTREYLSWNRARWAAFEELRRRGVTLEQMDGGVEINQYLIGGFDGPLKLRLPGMSVVDDRFILAFQPVAGYRELFREPYRSGLFGTRHVHALERTSGYRVK